MKTTRKPKYYILQTRTESGWQRIRGYKTRRAALDRLPAVNNCGTYRVITGDPDGAFDVVAIRCPAVQNDDSTLW